jgi:ABC-type Fe3+-hydroxamate transport system substrate-binding protein
MTGGLEARRLGGLEAWRLEGLEARRLEGPGVRTLEGSEAQRLGGPEAWRLGGSGIERRAVFALVLTLLVAGCGAGRDAEPAAESATHRIISLVPAATEMLFAMGAGPEVVGVSSFDRFPAEVASLPKVGALVDPDFERILTLRPTLVVVYESQEDLIGRLERASIPMYRYHHAVEDGLADIPRTLRLLGERVGRAEDAGTVAAQIERDLADVRTRVAGRPRPATALVFGREPGALRGIYVSGGVGFLHDLLETAGGQDVFDDVQRESLQASTEVMLARNPEVIIELRTVAMTPGRIETERAIWNRLAALPAVRNKRVHIFTDPALAIPGPRIALAARTFMAVLHPDAQ